MAGGMKLEARLLLAFLLVLPLPTVALGLLRTHAAVTASHPVEDTIVLLKRLGSQIEELGKAEALTYEKFEYWCANSRKSLDKAIDKEKTALVVLGEEIDAHTKTVEVLTADIAALETQLGELQKADSAAQTSRQSGENLFNQEAATLTGTIEAIRDAITQLSAAQASTAASLVQHHIRAVLRLADTHVSALQRSLLERVVVANATNATERPDLKAAGDYEAHKKRYSFKSGNVIELLKQLKSQFEEEILAKQKAETNAINAFALASAARAQLRDAAENAKGVKENAKTEAEGSLQTAQQAQTDTQNDLDADTGTLKTTTRACHVKASEWAERSKVRSEEKAAIEAAISILAKVAGVRTEAPGNPVPPPSPVLLQIVSPAVKQAVQLLRQEAHVSHSKAIAELAQAVAANEKGPFDQVINSIQKLVYRLMNEQREEDNHKNWCDKELAKTGATIQDKQDKIGELTTKINEVQTRAATLFVEIVQARDKVSEIDSHMTEATEIRNIGKEENHLAVKDAEAAQIAVTQAIAVLKEFYKSSGAVAKESWEFIQRSQEPVELPEDPSTWSAAYTGVSNPTDPTGILTVLEKVSADFAKMESETIAQEETDQNAYNEDMKMCKIEKARREKESAMKEQERSRLIDKQTSLTRTRKGVKHEEEATQQYLKDLEPACVKGSSTFDDRKAARAKEIEALQKAQGFLRNAFNATNQTR